MMVWNYQALTKTEEELKTIQFLWLFNTRQISHKHPGGCPYIDPAIPSTVAPVEFTTVQGEIPTKSIHPFMLLQIPGVWDLLCGLFS